MFKLKPGQFVYRQGVTASPNLYFIFYGSFACHTEETGAFGAVMCIGHTLGEEVLFSSDKNRGVRRTESVLSEDHSCVLQINVKSYALMRMQKHIGAGGSNFLKDYQSLNYILESHYL